MQQPSKSSSQPHLRVETPCPKAWNELRGGSAKRFCDQCSLHVHNASEMTRREAEALVRSSAERICMRLVVDPSGKPQFRPESTSTPKRLGLALAAGSLLAACQPTRSLEDSHGAKNEPVPIESPAHPAEEPAYDDVVLLGVIAVDFPSCEPAQEPPVGPEVLGKVLTTDPPAQPGNPLQELLGEVEAAPENNLPPEEAPHEPTGGATQPEPSILLGRVALPHRNDPAPKESPDQP